MKRHKMSRVKKVGDLAIRVCKRKGCEACILRENGKTYGSALDRECGDYRDSYFTKKRGSYDKTR